MKTMKNATVSVVTEPLIGASHWVAAYLHNSMHCLTRKNLNSEVISMKGIKRSACLFAAISILSAGPANAETGDPVFITEVRPYMGSNNTIFTASAVTVCDTRTYRIKGIDTASGKAALAAVYTAIATGFKVKIEVTNCTGWGSEIQSIRLTNSK